MRTLLVSAVLTSLVAGCAEVRDEMGDSVISIKGRTAAMAAWSDSREMFDGVDAEHHFADGFRAGYFNAAKFGPENRPPMPKRYTGHAYRSRRGQQRVKAWIDGFSHGTIIAMEELSKGSIETASFEAKALGASGEPEVSDQTGSASAVRAARPPETLTPTD